MLSVKRSFWIVPTLILAVSAHSDDRSLWQKFVDFFSPGEAIECDGPVCAELRNVESRINKVEGKYSRERRPVNKERFKKELDSLNIIRDSLVAIVKQSSSSVVELSSSFEQSSSSVQNVAPVQASSASVLPEVAKVESTKNEACAHDTVYVRDTVVVHDTLYVVVTNKPADVASEKPAE